MTYKPFKTYNRNGSPAKVHRVDAISRMVDCFGRDGFVAIDILPSEYILAAEVNAIAKALAA